MPDREAEMALRGAIEQVLRGFSRRQLAAASDRLTARYRGDRADHGGAEPESLVRSEIEAAAYAAVRLPATFAATVDALTAANRGEAPESVLDVGAGSGAASWAATAIWPTVSRLTLIDADPRMLELGRKLHAADPRTTQGSWSWVSGDISRPEFQPHDVVLASYALGELAPAARIATAQAMW